MIYPFSQLHFVNACKFLKIHIFHLCFSVKMPPQYFSFGGNIVPGSMAMYNNKPLTNCSDLKEQYSFCSQICNLEAFNNLSALLRISCSDSKAGG